MKSRILTALVLFPPVIYLIGWSPIWLFLAAVLTTVGLSLSEYFQICRNSGVKTLPVMGYVGGAAICLAQAAALYLPANPTLAVLGLTVLLTLSLGLRGPADLKEYLQSVSSTIFTAVPSPTFALSSLAT